jgi:hypothetical protein
MGIIDTGSIKVALKDQFSLARAKKAYTAGVAGAVTGLTTNVTIAGVLADGKIDGAEVVSALGFTVGGFLLGFLGAWLPKQNPAAPRRQDAVVYGDELGDDGNGRHEA